MVFENIYSHGIVRVAAATFEVRLGDPRANADKVVELTKEAAAQHAALVVFPQDCLTGVTVGDWGTNTSVTNATVSALDWISTQTADLGIMVIVGARLGGASRAVSIFEGEVYDDLDQPWGFTAANVPGLRVLPIVGPLHGVYRSAALAATNGFTTVNSLVGDFPGNGCATGDTVPNVTVVAHLAAPVHTVGSTRRLHREARTVSADLHLAVVQALGSHGESSTDGAFAASGLVAADGRILASETHLAAAGLTLADVVLPELSKGVRYTGPGFWNLTGYGDFDVALDLDTEIPLLQPPAQRPLVSVSERRYRAELREAFDIQRDALTRRLKALGDSRIILGVSGGLDSTLALLVATAAKATRCEDRATDGTMDPAQGKDEILTFTMPGFATSEHTKGNAEKLAAALGVSCELIDIRPSATEMLKTMGHPAGNGEPVYDITFENVQAGLRSDYLFRLANYHHGFVLGTGDLSESALGWTTYGVGDHISHYSVNCGVPKTLMPDLIREAVAVLTQRGLVGDPEGLRETVESIISTDVTPELIPDHESDGEARHQTTEGSIGPYLLHDFFLYHTLQGAGPDLVAFLALAAFTKPEGTSATATGDEAKYFTREEILKWLEVFYRRFLTQQYKRSTSVDGPVIWEGMTLSPRAGFNFPSDLSPEAVLTQLRNSVLS